MYQNQSDLYKYPHFCEVDNVDNWVYTNAAFYSLEYHSVFSSELCKDWKPVLKTSGNIFVSANMVKYGEVKQWSNLILVVPRTFIFISSCITNLDDFNLQFI